VAQVVFIVWNIFVDKLKQIDVILSTKYKAVIFFGRLDKGANNDCGNYKAKVRPAMQVKRSQAFRSGYNSA